MCDMRMTDSFCETQMCSLRDSRTGRAPTTSAERSDIYYGQVSKNMRNGNGKYIYKNTYFTYDGEWKNGKKDGHGRLEMRDGSFYEGEFVDGEIDGNGTLHSVTKANVYTGQFARGDKHGRGVMVSEDGTTYQGNWYKNVYQGKGCLRTPTGDKYVGEFRNHKRHGEGRQKYGDGTTYEGSWSNNLRDGFGKYRYRDGTVYEGNWRNDSPNGRGVLRHPNGTNYEATFVDGSPDPYPTYAFLMSALGISCNFTATDDGDQLIELRHVQTFEIAAEIRDSRNMVVETDSGREFRIRVLVQRALLDLSQLSHEALRKVESQTVGTPYGPAVAWPIEVKKPDLGVVEEASDEDDDPGRNVAMSPRKLHQDVGVVQSKNGMLQARLMLHETPDFLREAVFVKAIHEDLILHLSENHSKLEVGKSSATSTLKNGDRKTSLTDIKLRHAAISGIRRQSLTGKDKEKHLLSGEYLLLIEDITQPKLFVRLKPICIPIRNYGSDIDKILDLYGKQTKKPEKRWNTQNHIMEATAQAISRANVSDTGL